MSIGWTKLFIEENFPLERKMVQGPLDQSTYFSCFVITDPNTLPKIAQLRQKNTRTLRRSAFLIQPIPIRRVIARKSRTNGTYRSTRDLIYDRITTRRCIESVFRRRFR